MPMTSTARTEGRRVGPTASVRLVALRDGAAQRRFDQVVGEEPLEIRLGSVGIEPKAVAVTMRTPGHDFELAAGFSWSEGMIHHPGEIRSVRYCQLGAEEVQRFNVVTVEVDSPPRAVERRGILGVSASCGICGTASLEELEVRCDPVGAGPAISAGTLTSLPDRLRDAQRLFDRTGGLHAAGLYAVERGRMEAVREDVGRHNAVDKLGGWAALGHRFPLSGYVLVVSGRISFEIVQKAAVFGIPILVAVSAPSSLAIETAERLGITLTGFVREGRANLYTHPERVVTD